jgi:hypothetical protein
MGCHTWFYNVTKPTILTINRDWEFFPVTKNSVLKHTNV